MEKLKIKTWEDMKNEFGVLSDDGIIYIPLDDNAFTKRMDELLPENRIIYVTNRLWEGKRGYHFKITDNMIKEKL